VHVQVFANDFVFPLSDSQCVIHPVCASTGDGRKAVASQYARSDEDVNFIHEFGFEKTAESLCSALDKQIRHSATAQFCQYG
jgi:hypothetical protein